MFKFLRLFFLFAIALSSCIPYKKTVYFQENKVAISPISDSSPLKENIIYKIKPEDQLYISISSLNKEVSEFYNLSNLGSGNNTSNAYLTFYQVSDSGTITIPLLGKIEVKELSLEQAQNKILLIVKETVNDATVIVKLGTFKITMLGEVGIPGIKNIEGDKGTIFDAIALSGDVSLTADMKHVQIIRGLAGHKDIIELDLTDKSIINSEKIYLKPNDIVYVVPLKAKARRDNLAIFSRLIGFTSLLYLAFNLITRIK